MPVQERVLAPTLRRGAHPEGLLCVANFPSNTGYAWTFIEGLFAGVADALAPHGVRSWVAYPSIPEPPATLEGSAATPVELPVHLNEPRSLQALIAFIRRHRIRVLYLTDRASWHPAYPLLRLAGVRRIVVHDHTSGVRTVPRGAKRLVKQLTRRCLPMLADDVIAVSDYVARRQVDVALVPGQRVHRVWNSIPFPPPAPARTREAFGLASRQPLVACSCRAVPEKGVHHLLVAFDRVHATWPASRPRPVLLYFGDGPFMPQLAAIRERLDSKEHIIFAGFRADADTLTAGADLCVVPSTWAEAFGLAALEPMAHGIPVIASNAGGLPEVVVDGETGLLVPPGDEAALEAALRRLLDDPAERIRMGENGRRRAATYFTRESQLGRLVAILRRGFDGPGETADDGPGRRGGKIPARPAAEFEPVRTTASRPPS